MSSEQKSLEAALRAEPGNEALQAAYADYLMEQGNSFGEWLRLAVQEPDIAELEAFRLAHQGEWFGPFGRHLIDPSVDIKISYGKGWPLTLTIDPFTPQILADLHHLPNSWLQALALTARPPSLGDFDVSGHDINELVRYWTSAPLKVLSLSGFLTFGDALPLALQSHRVVNKLEMLFLPRCAITDESAPLVARWQHLRRLDLSQNLLSAWGRAVCLEAGLEVGPQQLRLGGHRDI
jgi:uncharacterized protein (TIGR02996 family)